MRPIVPDSEWMLLTELRHPDERAQAARLLEELGLPVDMGRADVHMFRLAEIGGPGSIVAAAAVSMARDAHDAEIVAAGVAPALQRHGIGRRLFGQLLDLLRARGAKAVVVSIPPAHRSTEGFVLSLGFERQDGPAPDGSVRHRLAL